MKIKLKITCAGIIITICLFFIACLGSSAASSNEDLVYGRYILIDKIGNGTRGFSRLVYDKDTYVMYVFNDDNAMSPYYIVKDKEATIGIYNVNWFGD